MMIIETFPLPSYAGMPLWAEFWNFSGQIWNGTAYISYTPTDQLAGGLDAVEVATGKFQITVPAGASAVNYRTIINHRLGGSKAASDPGVAAGDTIVSVNAITWNGFPIQLNNTNIPFVDVSYSNNNAVTLIPAPLPMGLFGASVELAASFASSTGGVLVPITVFQNTNTPLSFKIVDGLKNAVNLTGHSINFLIHDPASSTALFTIACTLAQSDPSGAPSVFDVINVTIPQADVANSGNFAYKVRDVTAQTIYAAGPFNVKVSP